ncbi:putative membrane binding protein [Staphylococcus phage Twort]|uniref:Membrane binding protein n=2 Tax=Staphylococcus phage Twort (strain DSM 17442 / HER 48) TaxID=2908167 RepID=A0A6H0X5B6_BPTWO|nr:ORF086 [Staphylococcus phage Twort]AAX92380.1 ORF086 [Staphylococcus phage Twort]QIW89042.1 putative membrane binding protein [Staphylococcus phage Twort]
MYDILMGIAFIGLAFLLLFMVSESLMVRIKRIKRSNFPKEIDMNDIEILSKEKIVRLITVSGKEYWLDMEEYKKERENGSDFIGAEGTAINKYKVESVTMYVTGDLKYNNITMSYYIKNNKMVAWKKIDGLKDIDYIQEGDKLIKE